MSSIDRDRLFERKESRTRELAIKELICPFTRECREDSLWETVKERTWFVTIITDV